MFKKKKNQTVALNKPQGKKKNIVIVSILGILTAAIAIGIFVGLSTIFSTDTYYVLSTNVSAKQAITPAMVVERETGKGTAPANALTAEQIVSGNLYARYPLHAGDVISTSNTGPANDVHLGVPDDWAITSFSIAADNAVGGILVRGDYVDLLGINTEENIEEDLIDGQARYIFHNLMLLDVAYTSDIVEEGLDPATVGRVGELLHYTVALPAEDVAMLHSALVIYDEIRLVKAPMNTIYGARDTSDLGRIYLFNKSVPNKDVIVGTDPTFSQVLRDSQMRPVNAINCSAGIINPEELCVENGFDTTRPEETPAETPQTEAPATETPTTETPAETPATETPTTENAAGGE